LGGFSKVKADLEQNNITLVAASSVVLSPENEIVQLSYSDGPLARTEADDVLKFVAFREKQRQG